MKLSGVLVLAASLFAIATGATPAQEGAPPRYDLPRTQVLTLAREGLDGGHVLYVSLPRDYDSSDRSYPVVLLLDPDYSFAIAHNIVEHFVDRGNLEPLVLVGLGYPGKSQDPDTYRRHRTRDYTPTRTLEGGYGPEVQRHSGGGPELLRFLEAELFPFLDEEFRLDGDRTLVGHSYGGLFATYVLLTRPDSFQRYLAVSPSYWYDDGHIHRLEQESAAAGRSPAARVALYIGAREQPPNIRLTMVDDLRRLARSLRSRGHPELVLETEVFEHETHNSVFPAALTRGLLWLFSDAPPRPE